MIVERLFVKIVFLQLWYAYICFKVTMINSDGYLLIYVIYYTIDETLYVPISSTIVSYKYCNYFQHNCTALCYNNMNYQ